MSEQHYLNGSWVGSDQLVISAFDLAVVRGFGIFDFFRTYNNTPFRIDDYLERFEKSAELLSLEIPISIAKIKEVVKEGIAKNNLPETGIRIILTGGVSEDYITPGQPTLMIIFKPAKTPPPEVYSKGVKVITWPGHRIMPEAKTLNYSEAVLGVRTAHERDAFEAIYTDTATGELFEGTGTNLFAVKDGVLLTPPEGVLPGVTRQVVIELAGQLGIKFQEHHLFLKDVPTFDEMFITSSSRQVVPVIQIDETTVADGTVGKISTQLKRAFEELVTID